MLKTAHTQNGTRPVHLAGVVKQNVDARDDRFRLRVPAGLTPIPVSVDNRILCSPIEDQGNLGSCTAHSISGLVEANENRRINGTTTPPVRTVSVSSQAIVQKAVVVTTTLTPSWAIDQTKPVTVALDTPSVSADGTSVKLGLGLNLPTPPAPPTPKFTHLSRLFQYYATRKLMGTLNQDSGASIRDAIKAAVQSGCADETLWPYNTANYQSNPPATVWTTASTHKVTSYHAITDGDLPSMKSALASGYLVSFGFVVYDDFMSRQMAVSGLLCRPTATEQQQGGHAVALVGYDDNKVMPDGSKGAFLVRNSWGTNWGQAGYFWMAYNYASDPKLAWDFWVIQSSPL